MKISELVDAVRTRYPGSITVRGNDSVEVSSLTHDSRAVGADTLFACVPGAVFDGHRFARDAIAAGARALVVERNLAVDVPQLVVDDSRRAMGYLAAALHGWPSEEMTVIGVTGTNGKTSVVHLLDAIFTSNGRSVDTIGTLTGERTTPESPDLQARLAEAVVAGADVVAMEVSSHALVQHRVEATRFAATTFTNLSAEHLDFHHTMEEYFAAKALLFTPSYSDLAIIDVDTPHGRLLADASQQDRVVRVSLGDIEVVEVSAGRLSYQWRGRLISVPIGGRFNVANTLVAAETALALGLSTDEVARGLASATPVPGRFEAIDAGQGFGVLVDYAHTPDALESLLESARELVADDGRLIVVFGCGGNRDHAKRPVMGRIASEFSDVAVVTTDNPRSEDPAAIIAAIVAGTTGDSTRVEPDRETAIASALDLARDGDVVVVAGKGHETTQTMGNDVRPFDDRAVARRLLTGGQPQ